MSSLLSALRHCPVITSYSIHYTKLYEVVLTISKSEGILLAGPDIISRGFVYMKESEELIDQMREVVQSVIDNASLKEMMQWQDMKAKIRKDLKKFLYGKTRRKPMILPIFMDVITSYSIHYTKLYDW